MKSYIKTIAITTSLSLILSCFVIGLNANNKYSNSSNLKSSIEAHESQLNSNCDSEPKLASLESPQSFEENKNIENWMFNSDFYSVQIEQEYIIEAWMLNEEFLKIIDHPCSGIQSSFIEKEWMNKHCFFIL